MMHSIRLNAVQIDILRYGGDKLKRFPKGIHNHLNYYVYRLIDPRDGATFYIGKGRGNRVFEHVQEAIPLSDNPEDDSPDDMMSAKIKVIQEIKKAGLEPIHVIHRHGMTEEVAYEVEAALIDATPGLKNEVSGHGSNDYGPAHVEQIIKQYVAEEIKFSPKHKIMVIKVRASMVDRFGLYDTVRCAWRVNKSKAEQADYVLAVTDGICQGVFVPDKWIAITSEEFPQRPDIHQESKRYGFHGKEANRKITNRYKGKRLPEHLRKPGMASPILYEY